MCIYARLFFLNYFRNWNMPKLNVTIKWSGKKFENLELGK